MDYTPEEFVRVLEVMRATRPSPTDAEARQALEREAALSQTWWLPYHRCAVLRGWLREYIAGRCELHEVAQNYSQHQRKACAELVTDAVRSAIDARWPEIPPDASEPELARICQEIHGLMISAQALAMPRAFPAPVLGYRSP